VIVTFPTERVMSALAPIAAPAPPTQPEGEPIPTPPPAKKLDWRKRLFRMGT
jgi:two-component system, cell cycle sensor histidine kinase PleC